MTKLPTLGHNEHLWQAWAWLHGHLWIDAAANLHEQVMFNGHWYQLHPVLNGIAYIPFALLYGPMSDPGWMSIIMTSLTAALLWRLIDRLRGAEVATWLTAVFALGTVVPYEATQGAPWGFCLLFSCVWTTGALLEIFGKCRPWAVGLLAGLAMLTRYDLILLWPVYFFMVRQKNNAGGMALVCTLMFLAYVAFSEARVGYFYDLAINRWYNIEPAGWSLHSPAWGMESIHYLPWNLYTSLFMAPFFSNQFPYLIPCGIGQALWTTTPAFVLAFRAKLDRTAILLWLCVVVGMGACLLVWANGATQFGARYWIQVYPFLFVLIALGMERKVTAFDKGLMILSIALCSWFLWVIHNYGFLGLHG